MRKDIRLGATALILCTLAACGTPTEPAAPAPSTSSVPPGPPPSPEQVSWLNDFCKSTAVLTTPPDPAPDLRDEFYSMDLDSYLREVSSDVDEALRELRRLSPEVFPRGADLIAAYTKSAEQLDAKLDEFRKQINPPEDVLQGQVNDTIAAVRALKPAGLELSALVKENGTAAQAHEQAEKCRPRKQETTTPPAPAPLPQARDGENLAACADGVCEVVVTPSAAIPVPARYGFPQLRVRRIGTGYVQVGAKTPGGGLMSGMPAGQVSVLNGLKVQVIGVGEGKAVLSLAPGR